VKIRGEGEEARSTLEPSGASYFPGHPNAERMMRVHKNSKDAAITDGDIFAKSRIQVLLAFYFLLSFLLIQLKDYELAFISLDKNPLLAVASA
jgi:hypothetical protein